MPVQCAIITQIAMVLNSSTLPVIGPITSLSHINCPGTNPPSSTTHSCGSSAPSAINFPSWQFEGPSGREAHNASPLLEVLDMIQRLGYNEVHSTVRGTGLLIARHSFVASSASIIMPSLPRKGSLSPTSVHTEYRWTKRHMPTFIVISLLQKVTTHEAQPLR